MYVNPFWLGVGVTLAAECMFLVVYGIVVTVKKGNRK